MSLAAEDMECFLGPKPPRPRLRPSGESIECRRREERLPLDSGGVDMYPEGDMTRLVRSTCDPAREPPLEPEPEPEPGLMLDTGGVPCRLGGGEGYGYANADADADETEKESRLLSENEPPGGLRAAGNWTGEYDGEGGGYAPPAQAETADEEEESTGSAPSTVVTGEVEL